MKPIKIQETKKNIFIEKNFVSFPKSLLSTQIFTIKGRTKMLDICEKDYVGYKSLTLKGQPLNLGIDFKLVTSVVRKINETNSNNVVISFDEFYSELDDDGSQPQNKNVAFIKRVDESAFRIASLVMRLEDNLGRIAYGSLFKVSIDPVDKVLRVVAEPIVKQLFMIDSNAIFNVDFRIYNVLKSEYSKKLYLTYLTNNVGEVNKFTVEALKEKLLCQNVVDKKFNQNIREANQELKDVGFLENVQQEKFGSKVTRYLITTNAKLNKAAKKERVAIIKNEKETKEVIEKAKNKEVVVVKSKEILDLEENIRKMEEIKNLFNKEEPKKEYNFLCTDDEDFE